MMKNFVLSKIQQTPLLDESMEDVLHKREMRERLRTLEEEIGKEKDPKKKI